jgi:hypothetical protein
MDPREREAKEAKERQRQQLLDRAYDQVVAKQLEKLGSKKTFTGESLLNRFSMARDVCLLGFISFFATNLTLPSLL